MQKDQFKTLIHQEIARLEDLVLNLGPRSTHAMYRYQNNTRSAKILTRQFGSRLSFGNMFRFISLL